MNGILYSLAGKGKLEYANYLIMNSNISSISSSSAPVRLGVLGSGKGSNFGAILAAIAQKELNATVVLVASDQPNAGILGRAKSAGIPTFTVEEMKYRTRLSSFNERLLVEACLEHQVELLVLAGYMRIVKEPFLKAYPRRIINIHPSLLPKFPGLAAWKQAVEAGETVSGCTVHYVDDGIDTGEILAQSEVPVFPTDTPETLHERIQIAEHHLFPLILQNLCQQLVASQS